MVRFFGTSRQQADYGLQTARHTAQITFANDVLYRRWAANHGGVYVRVSDDCPPNPYLEFPDRDVTTTSGVALTLVNPAYMARQVNTLADATGGIRGHLTSLKPIRPENAPDPWEAAALRSFEEGVSEAHSIEPMEDGTCVRLMRPFIVEQGCLTCHGSQGYKLGDIRGGVSVSVPMAPLRAIEEPMTVRLALAHLGLWVVGMVGIGGFRWGLGKEILGRQRIEVELREALANAEEGDRMLSALMENVPEGITIADASGHLRMVSRRGQELLGGAHADKSVDEVVAEWAVYEPDGETPMPAEKFPLMRAIQMSETVEDAELVQKNGFDHFAQICLWNPVTDYASTFTRATMPWGRSFFPQGGADEAVRQCPIAIPDRSFRFGVRMVSELYELSPGAARPVRATPLLVIHGLDDQLVNPANSAAFVENQQTPDARLALLEQCGHGLRERIVEVCERTIDFFDRRESL